MIILLSENMYNNRYSVMYCPNKNLLRNLIKLKDEIQDLNMYCKHAPRQNSGVPIIWKQYQLNLCIS